MGKFLVIVMMGFAITSGIMTLSKNRRALDMTSHVSDSYHIQSTANAANSGVYMALAELFLDKAWRDGYAGLTLNGDSIKVTVENDNSKGPNFLRVVATSSNDNRSQSVSASVFDARFTDFAVWAKGSVTDVETRDEADNPDTTLRRASAPFMPQIVRNALIQSALDQWHVHSGSEFRPTSHYPSNQNFYYSGTIPNVTYVQGDLVVEYDRRVYGIFVVEGHVKLYGKARVEGVLVLPNSTSVISHEGLLDNSTVRGGVLTWGSMKRNTLVFRTRVRIRSEYWQKFADKLYVPSNPPIRVLSWQ